MMPGHPPPANPGKKLRRLFSTALLLGGGYLFGVATLGGCSGPTWPSNGQLPDRVIEKLSECGKNGPIPVQSTTYNLSFIVRVEEGEEEVHVEEVMLKDSTLQMHEVEACMVNALYLMRAPLQVLVLRRRSRDPAGPVTPEMRSLLGQAQVIPLVAAEGLIVVGLAIYAISVFILEETKHKKRRPTHTTVEPEPTATPLVTAAPVASATPTTTATPTATVWLSPTAVPLAPQKKWEEKCLELQLRCLENPAQPWWNRHDFGQKKPCGECFRECKNHANGEWPDYKCPQD